MKILMITSTVYDGKSAFNHLLKALIEGFISHNMLVQRIIAINKDDKDNNNANLEIISDSIKSMKVLRSLPKKSNFVMRFVTDFLASLKMSLKSLTVKGIDAMVEDLSYSSIIPVVFAKLRGIPIVLMVQDVWPDNAVESGMLNREGLIYKFFDLIQRWTYNLSDSIVTISQDIKCFLNEKGVNLDKISVVYNWGYSDDVYNICWEDNEFVRKFRLSSSIFYVIYAGNIGKMQNVDIILKAANQLKTYEDIRFLIVGDGVSKDEKVKVANNLKLDNVEFLPMQPAWLAPHIYSAAGINVIPLVKGGVKTALPSKTGVCLSCGKPIILCVEKESFYAKLIYDYDAGVAVEPDDYNGLANEILRMYKTEFIQRNKVYKCFKDNFTKSENVDRYCDIIRKTVQERVR
jgi:glycosyltransferase involved in cell wall biosynthesis